MSKSTKWNSGKRVTIPWAFTLLFVALKLTGYIAWSWWWVFAPIWGVFLVALVFFGVGAIIAAWAARED